MRLTIKNNNILSVLKQRTDDDRKITIAVFLLIGRYVSIRSTVLAYGLKFLIYY